MGNIDSKSRAPLDVNAVKAGNSDRYKDDDTSPIFAQIPGRNSFRINVEKLAMTADFSGGTGDITVNLVFKDHILDWLSKKVNKAKNDDDQILKITAKLTSNDERLSRAIGQAVNECAMNNVSDRQGDILCSEEFEDSDDFEGSSESQSRGNSDVASSHEARDVQGSHDAEEESVEEGESEGQDEVGPADAAVTTGGEEEEEEEDESIAPNVPVRDEPSVSKKRKRK